MFFCYFCYQYKISPLNRAFLKIGAFFLVIWLISGCSVKKYLNEGDYIISKYKLQFTHKPEEIKSSDLRSFFKPKPNASFLGSRWKLHNYYKAQEKPTKFNKWLERSVGEYPVLYDEDAAERIRYKIQKYLDNIGFFHSSVSFEVTFGKKTAELVYTVKPAEPYRIKKITYEIPDTLVRSFFNSELKKTLVREGHIYNAYTLDNERDRITDLLRDNGYYYFNRNYVQFIIDSSFQSHSMNVELKINNVKTTAKDGQGESQTRNHRRYFIKSVNVIPDWKPTYKLPYDTVYHTIKYWNDTTDYRYTFLLDQKKRLKPAAFNSSIKIKPGRPYSATSLQRTYRGLFNFGIIRTATITFDTTNAGAAPDGSYRFMNSTIQMQTAKLNTFQAELEGTNSSGDLGVRGNVIYSNRNIFKKAEIFSIRVNGGFEAQSVSGPVETGNSGGVFNTFEAGFSGNIFFPRFLFPWQLIKFNQRYTPTTTVNFGFNYQRRPNYTRNITNLDLGYSWEQNLQVRHILTPITINYVNISPTPEFDSIIQQEPNQRLREQYSDHLIAGFSYSFIFNNQNLRVLKHFNYVRTNIESSGNLLYGINSLLSSSKSNDGFYRVGGVRYAQYVRWNIDFRHYYYFLDKDQSLVFRFLFGIAIPYLNSNQVPYEKGFFAGGANDMRGWQFRTLGPGGYSGTNDYERVGDIQIQGNVEYRFEIYKALKGAFFADVGNIWTLTDQSISSDTLNTYPDGNFLWDTWYRQLAVDAGFGLRLDFQFFIFRLDMAIPIIDPAYWREGENIRLPLEWNRTVFNFGIGYPF